MKYRNIYLLLFTIHFTTSSAQDQIPLFGTVGSFMESIDPSESNDEGGIILFDIGEATLAPKLNEPLAKEEIDLKVKYTYRRKVYIHDERAFAEAIVNIPLEIGEFPEEVADFKAVTFFMQADSSWDKVSWDEIVLKQEVLNRYEAMATYDFPEPTPRIVIEYTYSIYSDNFYYLRNWEFQRNLPVAFSKFSLSFPEEITYNTIIQNQLTNVLNRNVSFEQILPKGNLVYSVRELNDMDVTAFFPDARYSWNRITYSSSNIPGWNPIPYISNKKDVVPVIKFQLFQMKPPINYDGPSVGTWENVNDYFLTKAQFEKVAEEDITSIVRSKRLTFRVRNKRKRSRMVFDFVRENFSWNGEFSIHPQNLEQVWESQSGSGAEINLILLNMLRAVKLEAYPVLISTRDHGKINPLHPFLNQFNHLVIVVKDGASFVLLDALSDVLPFGVIPRNDLNYIGFIVDKLNFGWIELNSEYILKRRMHIRLDLMENLAVTGELYGALDEYAAASGRGILSTYRDTLSFITDQIFRNHSNMDISESRILYSDELEKPLVVRCQLEVENLVRTAEDLMFIRPMVTSGLEDNPFEEDFRQTAIEFNTPIEEKHFFTIRLPEGFETVQLPHPIHIVLPNNAGSFLYNWQMDHNILQMVSEISINRRVFYPEEYPNVKVFFNYIFNKHEEDIILRRVID